MTYKAGTTSGGITSVNGDPGPAVVITAAGLGAIPSAEKGATNGVGTLDASGKAPITQLPIGKYIQIESVRSGTVSPSSGTEGNLAYISFATAVDQDVNIDFRIPQDYISGDSIILSILYAYNGTAGDVKIDLSTSLFRAGTDPIDTAGGISSDTSTFTVPGTALELASLELDLDNGAGLIGGVSVSAGDLIVMNVSRNGAAVGDTGANEFYIINMEIRY